MLAHVVGTTPSMGQNQELKSALSALGELVSKKNHISTPSAAGGNTLVSRSLQEADAGKLEHPPWEIVKGAIDHAKSEAPLQCSGCQQLTSVDNENMGFTMIFPFFRVENMEEIMEEAYKYPQQCGTPRRVLAYGIIYNLLIEFASTPWGNLDGPTLRRYVEYCSRQGCYVFWN